MDIESLRVRVTEEEFTSLAREHTPEDTGVKDLRVQFVAEGIQISGRYVAMMVPLSFESMWVPSIDEGIVQARLTRINVAGFPATRLSKVLLQMMADQLGNQPGVSVKDDMLTLDVEALLKGHSIPVHVIPRTVRCQDGVLIIEAGV